MSKKQKRILWPIITLLILTLAAVGFVTTRHKTMASPKGDSESTAKKPSSAIAASAPQGAVQMVRFTVYDAGIFPREAHASPGWVAIQMQDMSGASAGLVVLTESRQALGQIVRDQSHWRASARMHLEPGRYRIFDASQPSNWATLIVEP
jgi:hypothetical protein